MRDIRRRLIGVAIVWLEDVSYVWRESEVGQAYTSGLGVGFEASVSC